MVEQDRQPVRNKLVTRNIKILEINLHRDYQRTVRVNWNATMQKIERTLCYWKKRSLSYQSKSTVILSSALSKVTYLSHVIHPPQDVVNVIQQRFWDFLWDRRPLVKRTACMGSVTCGGLWILHVRLRFWAITATWIPRLFDNNIKAPWKTLARH